MYDQQQADLVREVTRLRAALVAAHACIEAADKLVVISMRKHDFWDAYDVARAHYDRVRATPADSDAKLGRE